MSTANRNQVVNSCIESLRELATRREGVADAGSIQKLVWQTLELAGPDPMETGQHKALLADSLRKNANLWATAASEVAEVLMRACHVTASL